MQAENYTFSDFSRRTDRLAAALSVKLDDLPARIGISRAMLFNYRAGKSRITPKAWGKLDLAERSANIRLSGEESLNLEGLRVLETPQTISSDREKYRDLLANLPRAILIKRAQVLLGDPTESNLASATDIINELNRRARTAQPLSIACHDTTHSP